LKRLVDAPGTAYLKVEVRLIPNEGLKRDHAPAGHQHGKVEVRLIPNEGLKHYFMPTVED